MWLCLNFVFSFLFCTIAASPLVSDDDRRGLYVGDTFSWGKWVAIRGDNGYTYMWCDKVALEFHIDSNGWLKFLLDGKSYIITSGNKKDNPFSLQFNSGLRNAMDSIKSKWPKLIEYTPGKTELYFGTWVFSFTKKNTIVIKNNIDKDFTVELVGDSSEFKYEKIGEEVKTFTAKTLISEDSYFEDHFPTPPTTPSK